jgi:hypothetical protein
MLLHVLGMQDPTHTRWYTLLYFISYHTITTYILFIIFFVCIQRNRHIPGKVSCRTLFNVYRPTCVMRVYPGEKLIH